MKLSFVEQCQALLDRTQSEDADLRAISNQIAEEEVILHAVLRRANSAEVGIENPIHEVSHAAAMLGSKKLGDVLKSVIEDQQLLEQQLTTQQ